MKIPAIPMFRLRRADLRNRRPAPPPAAEPIAASQDRCDLCGEAVAVHRYCLECWMDRQV